MRQLPSGFLLPHERPQAIPQAIVFVAGGNNDRKRRKPSVVHWNQRLFIIIGT